MATLSISKQGTRLGSDILGMPHFFEYALNNSLINEAFFLKLCIIGSLSIFVNVSVKEI